MSPCFNNYAYSFTYNSGSIINFDIPINYVVYCDAAINAITRNPILFPGQSSAVRIHLSNITQYYTPGTPATLTVNITGNAYYIGNLFGNLAPTTIVSNTNLVWDYSSLPSNFGGAGPGFLLYTMTTANMNDTVKITATINVDGYDIDLTNNIRTRNLLVGNSYDPNFKECEEPEYLNYPYNDWLNYIIHFQNTGNATAHNIVVTDTLSSDFDLSTFKYLSSSHICEIEVDQNIILFKFNNIMLPDSNTNEPQSHGYVKFKIKPQANLPVNTSIQNKAAIYFDYNDPVITNTTNNTIVQPLSTSEISSSFINIYPNPIKDKIVINGTRTLHQIQLFDITGRTVFQTECLNNNAIIDATSLSTGVYYLRFSNDNKAYKVIVQK
jgi:uncharacterized repeat protein (TIGR01451 family)